MTGAGGKTSTATKKSTPAKKRGADGKIKKESPGSAPAETPETGEDEGTEMNDKETPSKKPKAEVDED